MPGIDDGVARAPPTFGQMVIADGDRIFFAKNSAMIDRKSAALLDDLSSKFDKYCRNGTISVEGHADREGGPRHSLELSKRRALVVARYFVKRGIDAARIDAVGLGLAQPAVIAPPNSSDKESAYAQNRRAVMVVKGCR